MYVRRSRGMIPLGCSMYTSIVAPTMLSLAFGTWAFGTYARMLRPNGTRWGFSEQARSWADFMRHTLPAIRKIALHCNNGQQACTVGLLGHTQPKWFVRNLHRKVHRKVSVNVLSDTFVPAQTLQCPDSNAMTSVT